MSVSEYFWLTFYIKLIVIVILTWNIINLTVRNNVKLVVYNVG